MRYTSSYFSNRNGNGGGKPQEQSATGLDKGFIDALRSGQDVLKRTVLECIPMTEDGVQRKNLLNMVKARKLCPSDKEFRDALEALVQERKIRKFTRKSVEFWKRLK